ncbi:lipocalin-like domain-containing protein [Sphingomonas nostoxanthinifaciens]|uniref:lipocalin-like domain-containing protein n=1 Tax=Sphingomonas nostoxanthinifaciens TaxID=2872652 RepID=UPI001CC2050E|nr:carotenoid 1,2-hydratase [Sphingomonas nostoxanthinifaciens]UAK23198.1 carotenoid 1,2-hydratase [Sphingomonas nostoxanthinifaciens]
MRRLFGGLAALALVGAAPAPHFADVRPGVPLAFPRDHGAHPDYRTEWWYVTGWLDGPGGSHRGFQITFFRTATGIGASSRSAFAPRQILFAHAALSDPAVGHLLIGERIAREGLGLAGASRADADVSIDDWHLRRDRDGRFVAHVAGEGFALDLTFRPTQAVLPEGEGGYSRKGPDPRSASHYYSMPHLAVTGTVVRGARADAVTGAAWLDREWSSSYLPPDGAGWDWTGLNFDDGGALMAFRIRRTDGASLWAGGSWRAPDGRVTVLGPQDIAFVARHRWRSPRTGAVYSVDPVLRIRLPGGIRSLPLRPLFPDQELDGRAAGSPVYWEGAVTTTGGRGYLELTGYAGHLRL